MRASRKADQSEAVDPLDWWREHATLLAPLDMAARWVLCIPAHLGRVGAHLVPIRAGPVTAGYPTLWRPPARPLVARQRAAVPCCPLCHCIPRQPRRHPRLATNIPSTPMDPARRGPCPDEGEELHNLLREGPVIINDPIELVAIDPVGHDEQPQSAV